MRVAAGVITTYSYYNSGFYYPRTLAVSSGRSMLISSGDSLRTLSLILSGEGFNEREQRESPFNISALACADGNPLAKKMSAKSATSAISPCGCRRGCEPLPVRHSRRCSNPHEDAQSWAAKSFVSRRGSNIYFSRPYWVVKHPLLKFSKSGAERAINTISLFALLPRDRTRSLHSVLLFEFLYPTAQASSGRTPTRARGKRPACERVVNDLDSK